MARASRWASTACSRIARSRPTSRSSTPSPCSARWGCRAASSTGSPTTASTTPTPTRSDPHSPHVGHGEGLKGLYHAHVGWLFETHGQADWKKYAKDLYEIDPSKWIIGGLQRVGLAWNVVRITPERQAAKAQARVAAPAAR